MVLYSFSHSGLYFPVEVHVSAYSGNVVLFEIFHGSVQKCRTKWCSDTCSYEAQYTQGLEEVFERDTYCYIYGK